MSKDIFVESSDLSSGLLKKTLSKLDSASSQLASINNSPVYYSPTGYTSLYPTNVSYDAIRLKNSLDALRELLQMYANILDTGPDTICDVDARCKNDLTNWWNRQSYLQRKWWENTENGFSEFFTDLFCISKKTGREIIIDSSIEVSTTETETAIQTGVFDDNGSYGGDQGGPYAETDPQKRKKYYEIIRNNIDDRSWTEEELEKYLQEIKAMGCVYTAYANIIMQHFEKDPVLFEKVFGYPMFTDEGEFDFNTLIVDICSSQTKTVNGINVFKMQFALDDFLEDHKIAVVNDAHIGQYVLECAPIGGKPSDVVTPDSFQQLVDAQNHIIVSATGSYLEGTDGSQVGPIGGHGMVVTGVTADGRYVVSSWGKKYYLSPDSGTQRFWTVSFE
jgi:hypothetical protein